MKYKIKYAWFIMSLFLCLGILRAQNDSHHVIYLQNGSVIKGSLLELHPADSVKIQTADGNVFSWSIKDVEKIVEEPQNILQPVKPTSVPSGQELQENVRDNFSVYGGFAAPMGKFTSDNQAQWKASTGFTLGMQFSPGKNAGLLADISLTRNSVSFGGIETPNGVRPDSYTWNSYYVLGGFKIGKTLSKDIGLMVAPLFGLYISSSPYVQYSFVRPISDPYYHTTTYFHVEVKSGTSVDAVIGVMAQLNLKRLILGVRYLSSSSKFNMNVSWFASNGTSSYSMDRTQYISFIQMYIGFSVLP